MIDTSAIDAFLGRTLRAIRRDETAAWHEPGNADSGGDWTSREALGAIWSRIEFHGIPALLHEKADRLVGWPAKMLERIAEEARLLGLWEATHARSVGTLVEALDAAGVETVLMKGTALAYSIYAEPSLRRRGDSDLLIRPHDLDRAREVLKACGWRRNVDPHGLVFQEGWVRDTGHFLHEVDLHWEASDRPVLQRVLPSEDMFVMKRSLPRLCSSAHRADHALTIIHETINQKWHVTHGYWAEEGRVRGSRRLIWSVDFALLAQALDEEGWNRLVELCRQRGVGPLIAEALDGAAADLEVSLPERHLSALHSEALAPEIGSYFEAKDSLSEFWFDLRTAGSWRKRLAMINNRGLPPRSHLVEKYPNQSGWPTVLLQGRLLVETAGRIVRRVTT